MQVFDRTFRYHQLVTGTGPWLPAEYLLVQCQVSNGDQLSYEIRLIMLEVRANIQNALPFRTNTPKYQSGVTGYLLATVVNVIMILTSLWFQGVDRPHRQIPYLCFIQWYHCISKYNCIDR